MVHGRKCNALAGGAVLVAIAVTALGAASPEARTESARAAVVAAVDDQVGARSSGHLEFLISGGGGRDNEQPPQRVYLEWEQQDRYRIGPVGEAVPFVVVNGDLARLEDGTCWDREFLASPPQLLPEKLLSTLGTQKRAQLEKARWLFGLLVMDYLLPMTGYSGYDVLLGAYSFSYVEELEASPLEAEPGDVVIAGAFRPPVKTPVGSEPPLLYVINPETARLKAKGMGFPQSAGGTSWHLWWPEFTRLPDGNTVPSRMCYRADASGAVEEVTLLPQESRLSEVSPERFAIGRGACTSYVPWPQEDKTPLDYAGQLLDMVEEAGVVGLLSVLLVLLALRWAIRSRRHRGTLR